MKPPCSDQAELFHAPDQESPASKTWREAEAKKICAGCPLREPCLAIAMEAEGNLSVGNRNGIYGGLNEKERADLYGGPKRLGPEPSPCGTLAAYKRHQRKGEPICNPCREARRAEHHRRKEQVA